MRGYLFELFFDDQITLDSLNRIRTAEGGALRGDREVKSGPGLLRRRRGSELRELRATLFLEPGPQLLLVPMPDVELL